jgi:hypothetical protein
MAGLRRGADELDELRRLPVTDDTYRPFCAVNRTRTVPRSVHGAPRVHPSLIEQPS